jgi:GxxExxY protein
MNRQGAKDAKFFGCEPSADVDRVCRSVIGAAIEVHRLLGPGFLESVYEDALCVELSLRGIPFAQQVPIGVAYKGKLVGETQ